MGLEALPGSEGNEDAGVAVMHRQHRMPVDPEQHEVSFPVTWGPGGEGALLTLGNRAPPISEGSSAAPLRPIQPRFDLAMKGVAPRIILLSRYLRVHDPIDALVRYDCRARFQLQPTRNLLRRPALFETGDHLCTQSTVTLQPEARQCRARAC